MSDAPVSSTPAPAAVPSPAEAAKLISEPIAAPVEPQKAAAPVSTKRKLNLKVDGEEISEEFDPMDDEYMTRQLQLAKMAQKRAATAGDLQKRLDQIGSYLEQAKSDPKKFRALAKELGIDEKQLAATIIEEEIANSQKTPEQLAKESLENELRELREEREREQSEWKKREFERLQNQEMERYDIAMSNAIEKSDLPKSPYVVKKMADYMLMGLAKGIDIQPNDVLPLVREEIQEDLRQMFAVLPEETVEKLIGKDVLGKLRKKNVAKAKASGAPQPLKSSIPDAGGKKIDSDKPKTKQTMKQFFGI